MQFALERFGMVIRWYSFVFCDIWMMHHYIQMSAEESRMVNDLLKESLGAHKR